MTNSGAKSRDAERAGVDDAAVESLLAGQRTAVFGGPGTGKTEQLVNTYSVLAGRGGHESVLALTPSREHADILRDRLPSADTIRSAPAARSVHSYAFSLVSAHSTAVDGRPLDFISGADQEYLLASILEGFESGRVSGPEWPPGFSRELRDTSGFRRQMRDALNAVMGYGMKSDELKRLGKWRGLQEWQALARVLQDYEDLLAIPVFGGVDTAAVFAHAASVVAGDSAEAGNSWSFSSETVPTHILLDSAQDFPDTALDFLLALEAKGTTIGLWTSPDTTVQGFRGAGGRLFRHLAAGTQTFTIDGAAHVHRGAGGIRRVYDSLARIISRDLHRRHVPASPEDFAAGTSTVSTAAVGTHSEQARLAASLIRTWHDEGTQWDDIAVLSRSSGTASALAAELAAHGIPVQKQVQPLSSQPATAHILRLLALGENPEPGERERLCEDIAAGPYGELDAVGAGSLRRALLRTDSREDTSDTSLGALLLSAIDRRAETADSADAADGAVGTDGGPQAENTAAGHRIVRMLQRVLTAAEGTRKLDPESAVWEVWEAFDVADEWQRRAESDPEDERNTDLDAVIRLQTLAQKFTDRATAQAESFAQTVLSQAVAQDSLAHSGQSREVPVTTPAAVAHRDFEHVIIADVQEGTWPNTRVRGSVFLQQRLDEDLAAGAWRDADRTSAEDSARPVDSDTGDSYRKLQRDTVRDEGRMFLAALSRARSNAVVLAVNDGEILPSVFFEHVQKAAAQFGREGTHSAAEPRILGPKSDDATVGPASMRQLVGYARGQFENSADPKPWAQLLASLANAGIESASPETWSAWRERSTAEPSAAPDVPVTISPSTLETFLECPLKWLLSRHAGTMPSTNAQKIGTLVHSLAEEYPQGGYAELKEAFEEGFALLEFPSQWERDRQYAEGLDMVANLNDFLGGRRSEGYEFIGSEMTLAADSGEGWRIRGRIDRLERDSDGRLHIVDFKTAKTPKSLKDAQNDPQLGAYQAAMGLPKVRIEGEDGHSIPLSEYGAESGGGMLMYPRKAAGANGTSNRRMQDPMTEETREEFLAQKVRPTADGIRSAEFPATPSAEACRFCPVKRSCPAVQTGEDES